MQAPSQCALFQGPQFVTLRFATVPLHLIGTASPA
jgi:hypothetical protein